MARLLGSSRSLSMLLLPLLILLVLSAGLCFAKDPPVVQFINFAPLPGAGSAVNADGEADGQGALQVNIPVAYTPGDGYVNLGAYSGEYYKDYGAHNANGSGVLGFGFGNWPRFYGSAMAVSSLVAHDSKVVSGQLQFIRESARTPAVSIGVQDIQNKEEGDFGDVANTGVSYYAVATKNVQLAKKNVYLTLGYGRARFMDTVFYGASMPLSDHFSLAAEHDGYQYNTGLAWRPGGRHSKVTAMVAYNQEAGLLYGVQITGKTNSAWALPTALLLIRR